jgi:hypothetical protein
MYSRFFLILGVLCLAGCAGGSGYSRPSVITPQQLDCGPAGPASIRIWSPAEAQLTFRGRTSTLERDTAAKKPVYKTRGVAYASHGAFAMIHQDGQTVRCDFRPLDPEPEPEHPPMPAQPAPSVERLDVTPYL